jgi:hypothetical protein
LNFVLVLYSGRENAYQIGRDKLVFFLNERSQLRPVEQDRNPAQMGARYPLQSLGNEVEHVVHGATMIIGEHELAGRFSAIVDLCEPRFHRIQEFF